MSRQPREHLARTHRILLRLHPRAFREELGGAVCETLKLRTTQARGAGWRKRVRFWVRESSGLLLSLARERSPFVTSRASHTGRVSAHSRNEVGIMEVLLRDVRHAARRLLRAPSFTLPAVLTLALAIGATTAIFTLVRGVVLAPLPYPDSDRLIALDHSAPGMDYPSGLGMTTGLFAHYTEHARTLDEVALYQTFELTLSGDGSDPERMWVSGATPSLGRTLRVEPQLGRWFTEDDGELGSATVIVLSHGLWVRRYGRDPGVVGRTLSLAGSPAEIVGVMPAGFAFPDPVPQLWIPIQLGPENLRAGGFNFRGVARLRDGATLEAARTEQNELIARYPDRFPEDGIARTLVNDGHMASSALTFKEWVIGSTERTLWILLGGVGLVLLVACTNVANLFLVRTEVRQREVAVRRALGAGRTSMAGFFLSETVLLVGLGGAIGLAIAAAAVRVLRGFGPADLPRLHEVRIDAAVVLFTLVLSVVAALVFGLLSNVRGSESLVGSLRENGRGNTATRARMRTRHFLMGGQMALALILLIASALMGRSFQRLLRVDPGFEPTSALMFHIGLPQEQFPDETAVAAFHRDLLARIEQLPGVRAATATTCAPLDGLCWWDPVTVVGRPAIPGDIPPITSFRTVAEEYFETLDIELVSGRSFEDADYENGGVTVIDEQLARLYFPGEDPIGRRIGRGFSDEELTIIGVVRHVVARSLSDASPPAQMYTPLLRTSDQTFPPSRSMAYIVRASVLPLSLAPTIRRVIARMSSDVAMARIRTLEGTLREARAPAAFTATLLAIAGSVGLVLAVIGIYGVITYAVARRTGEIGVRMALGARPRDVAAMVLRQGAVVAVAGLFVGVGGALLAGRLLTSILYGVSPADPATYAIVSASLLVVAMIACWVPARRAARLDPLRALRAE